MSLYQEARQMIINEMLDHKYIIRIGDGIYEDMGGHHFQEHSMAMDDYIKDFLENHLTKEELKELMNRFKGDL